MTVVRSRRAGIGAEEARHRPLYARVLGLQYLRPSSLLCFLFFEGAIALAALLALAELVNWWVVAVLPASVAAMVKINDVVAGAIAHSAAAKAPPARGRAKVPQRPPRKQPPAQAPPPPPTSPRSAPPPPTSPPPVFPPPASPPPAQGASRDAAHVPASAARDVSSGGGGGDSSADDEGSAIAPTSPGAPEWQSAEQRARQSAARRYE